MKNVGDKFQRIANAVVWLSFFCLVLFSEESYFYFLPKSWENQETFSLTVVPFLGSTKDTYMTFMEFFCPSINVIIWTPNAHFLLHSSEWVILTSYKALLSLFLSGSRVWCSVALSASSVSGFNQPLGVKPRLMFTAVTWGCRPLRDLRVLCSRTFRSGSMGEVFFLHFLAGRRCKWENQGNTVGEFQQA